MLTGKEELTLQCSNDMFSYREHIKKSIIDTMKEDHIPEPRRYAFNRNSLNIKEPENVTGIKIFFEPPPYETNTMQFLSRVLENYDTYIS